jgi:carbamoyl-phosphate synthase large subunit
VPKRTDIRKILLIGSGPIIIGQACEFDYSGTQACKALAEEGYKVVLVNSNPATIMTDPEMAHRTYIEPITPEVVAEIIRAERPDALLPTVGGQTGLNTAMALFKMGVLKEYGVEMIGASPEAIAKAEDRELFKNSMAKIGLDLPASRLARNMEEARIARGIIGLPCVIRPAFTLGGTGGGIAYNVEEFEELAARGLEASMIGEILLEEYLGGWKEMELEVMRDRADNVVIVCSIENFDPMGVHTGDSITVAPIQTLTDVEYQRMRDEAIRCIREVGVDTGGSNIQFAIDPRTGRMVIIEMNPRVSRSSALASKATGFPIAKIAAKLAVGYTLDEIPNDITKVTPASFEPTIDYCVVKWPRWAFEKFPDADATLTTQMKSVGEAMAIGRTFKEAFQKAIRSMETGRSGLGWDSKDKWLTDDRSRILEDVRRLLITPNENRVYAIRYAMKAGVGCDEINRLTGIDPWFLENIRQIVEMEERISRLDIEGVDDATFREAKRYGYSDRQLAKMWRLTEQEVRAQREKRGITPAYKLVDTCAAEFEAYTPYYYSTYEPESEAATSDRPRIVILGGGPNRIGQGIEFDYCCVQAAFALREEGYETVMINSNPETVSTDYDTSDRLFFEPLTAEDVIHVCRAVKPEGVIVQLGGQTPLNIASALEEAGVRIIGTSTRSIDLAEDRQRFNELVERLKLRQPAGGIATKREEAIEIAHRIGFPVLVRPSYVLGGRAMELVYTEEDITRYLTMAVEASPDRPVLVDKFLEDAIEVDVDAISDGELTLVCGVMEHIEEAGIHSGDSACALPPYSLAPAIVSEIKRQTYLLSKALEVKGLMNVQYAVKDGLVYILEVNPRASRTVPFVSKATGIPWARLAAKVMTGMTLRELGQTEEVVPKHVSLKVPVFPFNKFPHTDIVLGPEMRSTGEVMGIDEGFGMAFAKAMLAAGQKLPLSGTVFLSVRDSDKRHVVGVAKELEEMGFRLISTEGTAEFLASKGVVVEAIPKIQEGVRPNIIDRIKNDEVQLIINTPTGRGPKRDEAKMRMAAVMHNVPVIATISGARATVEALKVLRTSKMGVKPLQEYHPAYNRATNEA